MLLLGLESISYQLPVCAQQQIRRGTAQPVSVVGNEREFIRPTVAVIAVE
jgi:hypothetical protein